MQAKLAGGENANGRQDSIRHISDFLPYYLMPQLNERQENFGRPRDLLDHHNGSKRAAIRPAESVSKGHTIKDLDISTELSPTCLE
jgi:hypothetical protein